MEIGECLTDDGRFIVGIRPIPEEGDVRAAAGNSARSLMVVDLIEQREVTLPPFSGLLSFSFAGVLVSCFRTISVFP